MKKGKTKAIGVSNFSQAEMERLVKNVNVVPAAHQFECHVSPPSTILEACADIGYSRGSNKRDSKHGTTSTASTSSSIRLSVIRMRSTIKARRWGS